MSTEMSDIRDVARDLMDLDYRMEQQIAELRELLVTLQGEQAELRDEFHTHATAPVREMPFGARFCGTPSCPLTVPHVHLPEGVVYT